MNEVVVKCPSMQVAQALLDQVTVQQEMDGVVAKRLSFSKILPEPDYDGYKDQPSGGMPDWWHWRTTNWGTKWDVGECIVGLNEADGHPEVVFSYDTAWAPSLPVSEELSKQFPDVMVVHSYDEPGMDFGGYTVFVGGDVSYEVEGGSRVCTWAEAACNSMEYEWAEVVQP
jgi:hypothetical protein